MGESWKSLTVFNGRPTIVTFKLEKDALMLLDLIAKERGLYRSALIRKILWDFIRGEFEKREAMKKGRVRIVA